jgi:hypothetical protein
MHAEGLGEPTTERAEILRPTAGIPGDRVFNL